MYRVKINGRKFLLSQVEFEKALSRSSYLNPLEVLDVVGGCYVKA